MEDNDSKQQEREPYWKAQNRYRKKATKQVPITLNKKTDADILAYLGTVKSKQGTIKEALREKMEREGHEVLSRHDRRDPE